jgi:HEAT repeat protein
MSFLLLLCFTGLHATQPTHGDLERRFREGNEAARLELLRGLDTGDPSVAKQALPVLIKALGDDSPAVRAQAADCLISTKTLGSDAIPALCKCLDNPDAHVRRRAVTAIRNIAKQPEVAVPALRKALHDPDFDTTAKEVTVPHGAAMALGDYGPAARDAYTDLLRIVKSHEDRALRGCALIALGQIRVNPEQVIVEALAILDSPKDQDLRNQAWGALCVLGDKGKPAVPTLLARFATREARIGKQPDSEQDKILTTVSAIEPDNPRFLQLLERILRDRDYDLILRIRAAGCLEALGMGARPYLPALAAVLSEDPGLGNSVMRVMRPFKGEAVSALAKVMRTCEGRKCIRCMRAISGMGKYAIVAIPDLQARLVDSNPEVREEAEEAIETIKMAK